MVDTPKPLGETKKNVIIDYIVHTQIHAGEKMVP
jgi:hypothetical protein